MAFQSNSSNLRNESINSFWFSPSIREKPSVSLIRLKSSLPPLKRMVIYFSRDSSPPSNRMECSCFSFQILPTSIGSSSLVTATGCFSYPNLINDRRQTNRAAASATELPDTSVSPTEYWALESCWGASSQNGLQMARANVLLYSLASSMIRVSGAIGKSLIVLKHKPNNHNFFKTGFVSSVF